MKVLWEKLVRLAGSNLGLKVVALTIALGLWLAGHRDIERSVEVPLEFHNIPAGLMVSESRIDFVVLRLTGPRTLVSTFDAETLKLALDLSAAAPGVGSFPLSSYSLNIPRGVAVSRITPPVVQLRLDPVLTKSLPVNLRFSNQLPEGLRIAAAVAVPPAVTVRGPAEEVKRLQSVDTVPFEIGPAVGSTRKMIRLATDGRALSYAPDQVAVEIMVEAAAITKVFGPLPVQVKKASNEYKIDPAVVTVRLKGPTTVLEKVGPDAVRVFVDVGGTPPGDHVLPLALELPQGVEAVDQDVTSVRVRIGKSKK